MLKKTVEFYKHVQRKIEISNLAGKTLATPKALLEKLRSIKFVVWHKVFGEETKKTDIKCSNR